MRNSREQWNQTNNRNHNLLGSPISVTASGAVLMANGN